jgi:hypothetical protein
MEDGGLAIGEDVVARRIDARDAHRLERTTGEDDVHLAFVEEPAVVDDKRSIT